MVAKSYIGLEQIGDHYTKNGREYIKVKTKSGTQKEVRWYTEQEFAKMYPNDNADPDLAAGIKRLKPLKSTLGFDKGYITIFKGDTYTNLDYFRESNARYHNSFGWYVVSTEQVDDILPYGIEPVQLFWDDIAIDENHLKTASDIDKVISNLIYDPTPSQYVGEVGDRITVEIKVKSNVTKETYFGTSHIMVFIDKNENEYVWITTAKSLVVGEVYKITGTVKEHKEFKNSKQTVLTRCRVN